RVRSLLHVHGGMAQEILTFDEQVWLAERFGFTDQPHLLAVEQFMQRYYQHTMGLHERCMRFLERCRRTSLRQRLARFLPAPKVDEHFIIRGGELKGADGRRTRGWDNHALLLQLFAVAPLLPLTL